MLIDLLLAVIVWWLTLYIIGKKSRYSRVDIVHFLPFILGFIWMHTGFNWYGVGSPGTFSQIPDAIALLVGYKGVIWAFYMGLSLNEIYGKNYQDDRHTRKIKIQLLQKLVWPFIVISFISYSTFWLMYFGVHLPIDSDYLGSLLIVIFVYFLTFSILRDPNQFIGIRRNSILPKYYKSNIDDELRSDYLDRLQGFMEKEKPFLDKRLSLKELSEALNIPANALSQSINEGLGKTFNDLINEYRLREVKSKLLDPSQDNKTILALAFESGFQSKASFNRIFKKTEGMTPSNYQDTNKSQPTL